MPKRSLEPIENERVVLRLLDEGDLPLTLSWRNQSHIRQWFLKTEVILEKDHYAWFERYRELDNDFMFVILAKDLNRLPVGQVSLYDIDWDAASAEFGRLMIGHPPASGKGYAKQAVNLVVKIGFERLRLKELHLEVKEDNLPAQKIYFDCGFVETSRQNRLVKMKLDLSGSTKLW